MKTKNALLPLLFSLIIQSAPANSESRSNDALSTIFSFPKVVSPILNGNVRTPELEFAFAALVDNLEALPSQFYSRWS